MELWPGQIKGDREGRVDREKSTVLSRRKGLKGGVVPSAGTFVCKKKLGARMRVFVVSSKGGFIKTSPKEKRGWGLTTP